MDYTVYGILQAGILEWVAVPFSRESSQPRDQTQVSCIAGRFFTVQATRGQCNVQLFLYMAFLVARLVKNLPAVQETRVQSLGWEDSLEKGMATDSSILAWRIPWTEKLVGYSPWNHKEYMHCSFLNLVVISTLTSAFTCW